MRKVVGWMDGTKILQKHLFKFPVLSNPNKMLYNMVVKFQACMVVTCIAFDVIMLFPFTIAPKKYC